MSDRASAKIKVWVPESECDLTFARSGGPGGQNVNKVSTKVTLRWNPKNSTALTAEQRQDVAVHPLISSRTNWEGNLVITEERSRSQVQNRRLIIEKLNELISQALTKPKRRTKTRPTFSSKQRWRTSKGARKQKKQNRKVSFSD